MMSRGAGRVQRRISAKLYTHESAITFAMPHMPLPLTMLCSCDNCFWQSDAAAPRAGRTDTLPTLP